MKKTVHKIFLVTGAGFIVLIAAILINTALSTSHKVYDRSDSVEIPIYDKSIPQHLAAAIQFQTISYQDPTQFNSEEFRSLHTYLEEIFPRVHITLKKEIINNFSLLFTWQGSDKGLKPVLLMAHQDVVPATHGTENVWDYTPFGGRIADGYVWGRGALDCKSALFGILEAIEILLKEGFEPRRTVYIAFGHDEEKGGTYGAARIAELLNSREIKLEYVLDEGGLIAQDIIPGISNPIALVGIAEKGYVSLELTVEGEGGHSSMPPQHTSVGILSRAITRIEDNPFPANLTFLSQFFEYAGQEMPFARKIIFANIWFFGSLVEKMLSKIPELNASIRTTTAATMFSGSPRENVLPVKASSVVNFRIMPGDSITSVINYVKRTIDDYHVNVRIKDFRSEPSPVSDICSSSYAVLRKTIHQVAGDNNLVVAPYLNVGATDSRYFYQLSENIYRFLFYTITPDDLKRIHGTNERISVENYYQLIRFYYQLIRNSDELQNK